MSRQHILNSIKKTPFPYLFSLIIPVTVIWGYTRGGLALLGIPVLIFLIIPILDELVGLDEGNLSEDEQKAIARDWKFKIPEFVYTAAQTTVLIYILATFSTRGFSLGEMFLLVFSLGLMTSTGGVSLGHELIHKTNWWERFCGHILITSVNYNHFVLEHVVGHHVNVSTPKDPTSARKGESVYAFLPRTIVGSFTHAWNFEKERLAKRNKSAWSFENRMIPLVGTAFLTYLGIFLLLGAPALGLFLAQSVVGIIMIEGVNYIEHYGLKRKEIAPGKYERVTPYHSWNASYIISNYLSFNIEKHSHHHAFPTHRYQTLKHFDDVPQMPSSYPVMIMIAFIPPLWKKIMDPKVDETMMHIEKLSAAK